MIYIKNSAKIFKLAKMSKLIIYSCFFDLQCVENKDVHILLGTKEGKIYETSLGRDGREKGDCKLLFDLEEYTPIWGISYIR